MLAESTESWGGWSVEVEGGKHDEGFRPPNITFVEKLPGWRVIYNTGTARKIRVFSLEPLNRHHFDSQFQVALNFVRHLYLRKNIDPSELKIMNSLSDSNSVSKDLDTIFELWQKHLGVEKTNATFSSVQKTKSLEEIGGLLSKDKKSGSGLQILYEPNAELNTMSTLPGSSNSSGSNAKKDKWKSDSDIMSKKPLSILGDAFDTTKRFNKETTAKAKENESEKEDYPKNKDREETPTKPARASKSRESLKDRSEQSESRKKKAEGASKADVTTTSSVTRSKRAASSVNGPEKPNDSAPSDSKEKKTTGRQTKSKAKSKEENVEKPTLDLGTDQEATFFKELDNALSISEMSDQRDFTPPKQVEKTNTNHFMNPLSVSIGASGKPLGFKTFTNKVFQGTFLVEHPQQGTPLMYSNKGGHAIFYKQAPVQQAPVQQTSPALPKQFNPRGNKTVHSDPDRDVLKSASPPQIGFRQPSYGPICQEIAHYADLTGDTGKQIHMVEDAIRMLANDPCFVAFMYEEPFAIARLLCNPILLKNLSSQQVLQALTVDDNLASKLNTQNSLLDESEIKLLMMCTKLSEKTLEQYSLRQVKESLPQISLSAQNVFGGESEETVKTPLNFLNIDDDNKLLTTAESNERDVLYTMVHRAQHVLESELNNLNVH